MKFLGTFGTLDKFNARTWAKQNEESESSQSEAAASLSSFLERAFGRPPPQKHIRTTYWDDHLAERENGRTLRERLCQTSWACSPVLCLRGRFWAHFWGSFVSLRKCSEPTKVSKLAPKRNLKVMALGMWKNNLVPHLCLAFRLSFGGHWKHTVSVLAI